MERSQHGKSKGVSGIEGADQLQKNKAPARLSSDSSSYFDGNSRDHRVSLEVGQSSTRRSTARPVVKLLADMYKGMKSKRKSSSFIARLMGLDRVQSQGHVDRKQKGLSDGYLQNNVPIDIQENNPGGSRRSHAAALEPSKFEKYEGNARARISDSGSSSKLSSSHLKHKNCLLLNPNYSQRAPTSNIQFEEQNATEMDSSRIYVLKPNLKNMLTFGGGHDASTNIGRGTTRQGRNASDESSDAKSSLLRGYDGDESSFDALESDSDSEWEMFGLSSGNSLRESKKWFRYPSSGSVEGADRTEKKRSERWRITEKYRDLEIVYRESTSGGMLSTPEKGTRSIPLNAKTSSDTVNSLLGSNRGSAMLDELSDIRNKDGWKVENQGNSSRSRSLPPVASSSNRKSASHDSLAENNQLMCGNTTHYCGSKAEKGSLGRSVNSHDSESKSTQCFPCQHVDTIDFSAQAEFELRMEANVKNITEQQLMFQLDATYDSCGSNGSNIVVSEHESSTLSFKSFLLDPEQCSGVDEDRVSICDQVDSYLQEPPEEGTSSSQHTRPQLPGTECSKEGDHSHTSPVSVLKVPFPEDASSCSESFDRINAEFHDLRVQLQLLNMDSTTCPYREVFALISLEKDILQLSKLLSDGNYTIDPDCWQVSYLLDVLLHSGLEETGFDILRLPWHSPDSPLDPTSFDDLEKKYSDDSFGSVSERNLLFDRINLVLFDIFQHHVDWFPWVRPGLAGLPLIWKKESARDAFGRMIKQECEYGEVPEKVIDREMQWTDYRGEIDYTGIEIEMMFIDEIIDDFLCDLFLLL